MKRVKTWLQFWELIEQAEEERDKRARKSGFIVAILGELYFKSLGKNSAIYIEKVDSRWETWREIHLSGKKVPYNCYVFAAEQEFEYVLLKAKRYLDYLVRNRT